MQSWHFSGYCHIIRLIIPRKREINCSLYSQQPNMLAAFNIVQFQCHFTKIVHQCSSPEKLTPQGARKLNICSLMDQFQLEINLSNTRHFSFFHPTLTCYQPCFPQGYNWDASFVYLYSRTYWGPTVHLLLIREYFAVLLCLSSVACAPTTVIVSLGHSGQAG